MYLADSELNGSFSRKHQGYEAHMKRYEEILILVIGFAIFLHPFRPCRGHKSAGIEGWNMPMEKYEGYATQLFYILDKNLKVSKIKAGEDSEVIWQRLLQ